jgi:hypothetical protein
VIAVTPGRPATWLPLSETGHAIAGGAVAALVLATFQRLVSFAMRTAALLASRESARRDDRHF